LRSGGRDLLVLGWEESAVLLVLVEIEEEALADADMVSL
jgi:hypothetical protein